MTGCLDCDSPYHRRCPVPAPPEPTGCPDRHVVCEDLTDGRCRLSE